MISHIPRPLYFILSFLKEVHVEMKKVNWLERQEVIRYTLLVFGLSLFVAVYLGALDYIFSWALRQFIF